MQNLSGIGMTSQRTRERLLGRLMDQGIQSMEVLDIMRSTPRHIFLDEALAHRAYEDVALPIGHNQTISQPYVVARMSEAIVKTGSMNRVLEIGTGCGYQTAVIAQLAKKVFTVERIKALSERAKKNLRVLGLRNIEFKHDDGSLGWADRGPFDAIITTAAPRQVPVELLSQLADGGRLIIPVGGEDYQELKLIRREGSEFTEQILDEVRFVGAAHHHQAGSGELCQLQQKQRGGIQLQMSPAVIRHHRCSQSAVVLRMQRIQGIEAVLEALHFFRLAQHRLKQAAHQVQHALLKLPGPAAVLAVLSTVGDGQSPHALNRIDAVPDPGISIVAMHRVGGAGRK